MPLVRSDIGGSFLLTAVVDLASHAATTALNTQISDPAIKENDLITCVEIPAALNAQIVVQGVHTVANGSFQLRTTNPSATAGVDPASGTFKFIVHRR